MKLALTISGLLNLAAVIFLLCRPVRYVQTDITRAYEPRIDSIVLKPEPRVDAIELDTSRVSLSLEDSLFLGLKLSLQDSVFLGLKLSLQDSVFMGLRGESRFDRIVLDSAKRLVSDSFHMEPVQDSVTVIWSGSK